MMRKDISSEALESLHNLAWGHFESKDEIQHKAFEYWNKLFDARNRIGEQEENNCE